MHLKQQIQAEINKIEERIQDIHNRSFQLSNTVTYYLDGKIDAFNFVLNLLERKE